MPSAAPAPAPAPKQHATHTHHTACEWNAVLVWHNSNPLELHSRHVMYETNKQTNKHGGCIFSLHILPYNVGNKISWVKNYCEVVVVVVARNPSCCSKSQSVYRFCGDAEGDKLLLQQQQQYLSKLFTKRPKLLGFPTRWKNRPSRETTCAA